MSAGDESMVERVARAIERARCPGREGPYGGYDYSYGNPNPPAEPLCVRDFRDPDSADWGRVVHRTANREEHEREFKRLTEQHIARAAIEAMREPTEAMMSAAFYDPDEPEAHEAWGNVIDAALNDGGAKP